MWDDIEMGKIKILTEDCIRVDDRIYFFAKDWNALYTANLEIGITEYIGSIPEENFRQKRLCAGIVYHKNCLILVPMTAKKIWIYNLKSRNWIGIERKYVTGNERHCEIFRAAEYKDDIFFIGSNYPFIIRMNMDSYQLEYFGEPYAFLDSAKKDGECYFRSDFSINKNQLLVASCLNNYVLCFNLDTFEYQWYQVGGENFQYSGITWDGKNYWLSPRRGTPIVKWNGKDKEDYFPLPREVDGETYSFLGVQHYKGKLFFPGMLQNKTIVLDTNSCDKISIENGQYTFYRFFEDGSLLSQTRTGLFQWKYSDKKQGMMYLEIPFKEMEKNLRKTHINVAEKTDESEIDKEEKWLGLYIFFCAMQIENKMEKKSGSRIGKNIWEKVQN